MSPTPSDLSEIRMTPSQSTVGQAPDSNRGPSRQSRNEKRHALAENHNQNAKRSRIENGDRKFSIDCITLSSGDEEEDEVVEKIPDKMKNRRAPIACITLSDTEDDDKSLAVSVDLQMDGTESPGPLPNVDANPQEESMQITPEPSTKSPTPEVDVKIEGIDRGFQIPIGLRRTPHVYIENHFDKTGVEKPKRFQRTHVNIGDDFQAEVDSEPVERDPEGEKDRDEKLWKHQEFEEHEEFIDVEEDEERIVFENTLHNAYWKAIWRQYEGHIPMEVALQHLMKNDYNIPKSLMTIDQTLKNLPQVFKPLCIAQAKIFDGLLKKNWPCMIEIQEKAMRNYHISEVYQYFWKFRHFYQLQKENQRNNGVVGCNCHDTICEDLVYEPRYGCANCTKNFRTNPIPTQDSLLCLICKTYKDLTEELPSSDDVVLNEDEMLLISQWDEKEQKLKRHVTREEFEKLAQDDKNEKWRSNVFTAEERAMLNLKESADQEDESSLTDGRKHRWARMKADKLQPFVLPHFTKCNCRKAGIVSDRSPNFDKHYFSRSELNVYTESLVKHDGDMEKVVEETGVELEILKRFVINHRDDIHYLRELFPDEKLPELEEEIPKPPASNLPPSLQKEGKKFGRRY